MYIDEEYIEEELERLKNLIESDKFSKDKSNNFIGSYSLEDDFSGNDIDLMQKEFMKAAKEYLSKNYPDKYAMWNDFAVHIITVEFYRKVMWENQHYREEYIRKREDRDIIK